MNDYIEFIKECDSLDLSGFFYTEVHHIIPKCFGGDNSKDNLITLPYSYHVKAHRLLHYAFPNSKSLAFAYCAVVNMTPKLKPVEPDLEDLEMVRYINSLYSKVRKGFLGKKHNEETKIKISNTQKGKYSGELNPAYCKDKFYLQTPTGEVIITERLNVEDNTKGKLNKAAFKYLVDKHEPGYTYKQGKLKGWKYIKRVGG